LIEQEKEPVFHIPLFLLLNSYLDLKQEISDHIDARTAKIRHDKTWKKYLLR